MTSPNFRLCAALVLALSCHFQASAQSVSINAQATLPVPSTSHGSSLIYVGGAYGYTLSSWSYHVPAGALPMGTTSVAGMHWTRGAQSLAISSTAMAWTGSGYYSQLAETVNASGRARVVLTAPVEVAIRLTISGSLTATGYSLTRVTVDGATVAMLSASGIASSFTVPVGPSGTEIEIEHSTALQGPAYLNCNLTVDWTREDTAGSMPYGLGCGGGGHPEPVLTATSVPVIGGSMSSNISQVPGPTPIGFLAFGFSEAMTPLDSIGMPGCSALQSADLVFPATPLGNDQLTSNIPIPNDPSLVGARLYSQAFCYAPGANLLEVISSAGLRWQLGN